MQFERRPNCGGQRGRGGGQRGRGYRGPHGRRRYAGPRSYRHYGDRGDDKGGDGASTKEEKKDRKK